MSNSRELSLEEDLVFEPVTEACPQFLYSESERCALECLLSNGPGAFYMQLNAERLGPFLSPDEVNQLSGWTQDYRSSEVVLEEEAGDQGDGEGPGTTLNDFSARYFPTHSDTPAPPLELGWPEKECWDCMGQARVYTSPPVENAPPVREVVRKILQGARKLIAIVTDRLSDSAVIGDLHTVASLGVPVYIILNQRSVQENFTPHRLRHPNIRVRILGGKTFCSREGKMVVGELKENFLLVDLEKVMVGSYSLTWTDAHLHRQLVMVMSGPVVESFDREFRILYAASLPIPDTWKGARPMVHDGSPIPLHSPESLDASSANPMLVETILSPPPAFTDQAIDWEALGVIQRGHDPTDVTLGGPPPGFVEGPVQHCGPILEEPMLIEEKSIPQQFVPQVNLLPLEESRTGTNLASGNHVSFRPLRRWSQQSDENRQCLDNPGKQERLRGPLPTPTSPNGRREPALRRDSIPEESTTEVPQPVIKAGKTKRPLILRVPQMENFSSLSDILRRIQGRQSSAGLRRGSKAAVSDISRSMMDLSTSCSDKNARSQCYEGLPVTPALALMKQRTDEKNGIVRPPKTFLSSMRPRSSTFTTQKEWGTSSRRWSDGK